MEKIQQIANSLGIKPFDLNYQHISRLNDNELRDLSISRTTFDWGIKFPNSSDHIVYVWCDALLNYVSALTQLYGLESNTKPNYIHIIGKDIVWFHAIIYPAILKSINAETSIASNILVHGFIMDENGVKMLNKNV